MKNRSLKNLRSLVLLAVLALFFVQCETTEVAGFDNNEVIDLREAEVVTTATTLGLCECLSTNYSYEAVSTEEKASLIFMREEEKLARDVYLALFDQWNNRVFSNIAKAEQKHMDVMLCLMQKYELTDPVGDSPNGVFQNNNLQELYNTLMEQGGQSLIEALKVGATIEDVDIFDLMNLSENVVDNEDMLAAYKELTKGSRNHLRAFMRQLTFLEGTYVPQFISADLFNEILNAPRERGGELCFAAGTTCINGGMGNNGMGNNGNCPNGNTGEGNNGTCPLGNDGTCPNGNAGNGGNGGNGNGGHGNGGHGNGGN